MHNGSAFVFVQLLRIMRPEMIKKNEGLGTVIEKYLRRFYADAAEAAEDVGVYDFVIEEVERCLISVTLDVAKGNRLKTAKILGLNRNTLLRKMRRLNLDEKFLEKEKTAVKRPLLKKRRKK